MMRPVPRALTNVAILKALLVIISLAGSPAPALAEEPATPASTATPTGPSPPVIEAVRIGGVDARSAALLLSGQQSGDVEGALTWTLGAPDESGRYEVRFVVEVDGAALVARLSGPRIALGFFTYAIEDAGPVVDHSALGVVLESEADAALVAEGGLRAFGRIRLAPGSYTLRVMIRERESQDFFMAQSRVVIPQPGETPTGLLTSVFPDPGGTWLTIHQPGVAIGLDVNGGDPVVQAARPVLLEGRPTEFFIGGAGVVAPALDATLTDAAGRVLAEFPVKVSTTPNQGAVLRRAALPVIDLPRGHYTLVLETGENAEGLSARQSMTVALVGGNGPHTWLDRPNRQVNTARSDIPPSGESSSRFRRRKARSIYIGALRNLADGKAGPARLRLMDLERLANSRGELRSLRRVEDAVAGHLAAADPKSLLPIALLHQQLVRRYVARNDYVLASFARSVAAERAAQIAGDGGEGRFAAALLVNLASDLARTASATLATSYLEEALAADPSSRAALLALGAISERSSDHNRAVHAFERLVEDYPDFAEGRLRLAVNLARSGRERAAEREFRALPARQAVPWVDAIGAQEYARLLIKQERRDEAKRVLRTASERLPADQRLWILAAYTADAEGMSLGAVEAILQIPSASAGVSPRVRYTEWPKLGTEASAASLRSTATSALPNLSAALEALGGQR